MAALQEVEGDNTAPAASSANANVLHVTSTPNEKNNEGNDIKDVNIPPNEPTEPINIDAGSGDENEENNIKEVDIPPNEPTKLINVDAERNYIDEHTLGITLMVLLKCKMMKETMMAMTLVIAKMKTIAPRE